MSEESKNTFTVISCNSDNTFPSKRQSCISRFTTATCHQSASIEINKYRQLLIHRFRRCPHIEIKTIFAHLLRAEIHIPKNILLHRIRSELVSLTHSVPLLNRLRSFPSEVTHRRGCEWNSLKNFYAGFIHSLERAVINSDFR